ncbi:MAG: peptidylprolyl isomerase [Alcanivoracaceae bacterium]|nr:peptidylprolyl isomerase [Alcanivoracaceae bacterium]
MTDMALIHGRLMAALLVLAALAGLAPAAMAKVEPLDRIAAVVEQDVIMESELNDRVEQITSSLRAEQQRMPPAHVLREQVLDRMILERLQLAQAERGGIKVDDTSLNEALAGIARGNDLSLEEFVRAVEADGLSWPTFREEIRSEMIISQLRQRRVGQRIRITDREVDRFLDSEMGRQLFAVEFRLGHILVSLPDGASPQQLAEATKKAETIMTQYRAGTPFADLAIEFSDGQYALEGGDLGWRPAAQIPSLFTDEVIDLDTGDIVGPIRSGAGLHILKMIDRKGDVQKFVEQYKVRHVLIKPSTIRDSAASLALARELRQKILDGADFSDIARAYSDDPGSARDGGSLDWVSPGEMVDAFEQRMTQTPVGDLSGVFETPFGWHFLQVTDTRTADMSEDFRRMKARQALHKRRFEEELDLWLQELREEAFIDIRI